MFVLLCLRHEAVGRKLVSPKPEISHGGLLVKFDRVTPARRGHVRARAPALNRSSVSPAHET
ncbi:hypothetical protein EGT86_18615 [Burkholderia pseudomallei]|nr:hypothetical protein CXQ84_15800 [Burkholderia pseudomallei]RPA09394.1 hypothetical protein EGT86_18615 [Burkholderia pseudomallei]